METKYQIVAISEEVPVEELHVSMAGVEGVLNQQFNGKAKFIIKPVVDATALKDENIESLGEIRKDDLIVVKVPDGTSNEIYDSFSKSLRSLFGEYGVKILIVAESIEVAKLGYEQMEKLGYIRKKIITNGS